MRERGKDTQKLSLAPSCVNGWAYIKRRLGRNQALPPIEAAPGLTMHGVAYMMKTRLLLGAGIRSGM